MGAVLERRQSVPSKQEVGVAEKTTFHIGVIMDGNRRFAKLNGLSSEKGHEAGVENIRNIIKGFAENGVTHLTLFAFSVDNWQRSKAEVASLMGIMARAIHKEIPDLKKHGIKFKHIGSKNNLSKSILRDIRFAENETKDNDKMTVYVAFDYGGQEDILNAVRSIVRNRHSVERVDKDLIRKYLYAPDAPDFDIILRTSGEKRISNFSLWQSAYAEFIYRDKYWPDFSEEDIIGVIEEYHQRKRKFGGDE